jgi:oxygen-dependent protoporphyrinogen oxidase
MVDALVVRLERERIWTRAAVYGVSRANGGFSLAVQGGETVSADQVIVAAPGPKIAPALEGLVPGAARALAAIPFASSATVLLGYRRADVAHPLGGYGMVVPQTEGLRTTALNFVSTKLPHRAPEGRVLLRGFLGGVRDREVMGLSDDEMVETVRRDMAGILGLRGRPVMTRVFRWPGGTPQLEVGHIERMTAVEADVIPRLPHGFRDPPPASGSVFTGPAPARRGRRALKRALAVLASVSIALAAQVPAR